MTLTEGNSRSRHLTGMHLGKCLYTILSVSFPKSEKTEMLLFNLDINHICASGGSACTSGAQQGSHVIRLFIPAQTGLQSDSPSADIIPEMKWMKLLVN